MRTLAFPLLLSALSVAAGADEPKSIEVGGLKLKPVGAVMMPSNGKVDAYVLVGVEVTNPGGDAKTLPGYRQTLNDKQAGFIADVSQYKLTAGDLKLKFRGQVPGSGMEARKESITIPPGGSRRYGFSFDAIPSPADLSVELPAATFGGEGDPIRFTVPAKDIKKGR